MRKVLIILSFAAAMLTEGGAYAQSVKDGMLDLFFKCGAGSGKTPDQLDPETRHQCEEYAARANKALGLSGPGFAVKPEVAKRMEFDAWRRRQDAWAAECKRVGTFEGDCSPLAPASLQVQRRKALVNKYCKDHDLPPNCKAASAIPGRTR